MALTKGSLCGQSQQDLVELRSFLSAVSRKLKAKRDRHEKVECYTPQNLYHWLGLYINFQTDKTDETNKAKILC